MALPMPPSQLTSTIPSFRIAAWRRSSLYHWCRSARDSELRASGLPALSLQVGIDIEQGCPRPELFQLALSPSSRPNELKKDNSLGDAPERAGVSIGTTLVRVLRGGIGGCTTWRTHRLPS